MSEIAYVHCAATGCPAAGASTRATSGSTEWWCCNHFGAAPGRTHEITAELRRMAWLVQLCKCIWDHINTGMWTEHHAAAHREIALHQRSDLELGGAGGLKYESYPQWLHRLEGVLQDACKAAPESQQPLEV